MHVEQGSRKEARGQAYQGKTVGDSETQGIAPNGNNARYHSPLRRGSCRLIATQHSRLRIETLYYR